MTQAEKLAAERAAAEKARLAAEEKARVAAEEKARLAAEQAAAEKAAAEKAEAEAAAAKAAAEKAEAEKAAAEKAEAEAAAAEKAPEKKTLLQLGKKKPGLNMLLKPKAKDDAPKPEEPKPADESKPADEPKPEEKPEPESERPKLLLGLGGPKKNKPGGGLINLTSSLKKKKDPASPKASAAKEVRQASFLFSGKEEERGEESDLGKR